MSLLVRLLIFCFCHSYLMTEIKLNGIIKEYEKTKEDILTGLIFKLNPDKLREEEVKCASLLDSMSNQNEYAHFDEVVGIQEQYKAIRETLTHGKNSNYSQKQLETALRNIVKPNQKTSQPQISSISEIRTEDVIVPEKSKTIEDFFKKKEAEISKKDSSFKRILDSKEFQSSNEVVLNKDSSKISRFSKSRSNFRKGDEEKEMKIKTIIDQHKKSLGKLQLKMKQEEELNDFQKNLLREEKNRYLGKIEELEGQIQQLYRDNYRLRELQKTVKEPDSFNVSDLNEKSSLANAYEPYVIKTRSNDLNKINQKNYKKQEGKMKEKTVYLEMPQQYDILGDKLEKQKPLTAKDFFNRKSDNQGLYGEKFPEKKNEELVLKALLGDSFEQGRQQPQNMSRGNISMGSINNGTHFDTFHMARTLSYINESVLGESRNVMMMTGQISTRNKVAFFKNSLVLVRNSEVEIAFKKSDMNERMDKVRIILYVYNKTPVQKMANINYEYQQEYFDIRVKEKLTRIPSKGQGREELEVSLISKVDLNGVTDLHIQIGDLKYDLWLPINFIRFKHVENYHMPNDTMDMTVLPDRQFASFNSLQEIIPAMFGGTDSAQAWGYLYGQSKFGNFPVKLTWKMKDLTIQTSDRWLDFLGFVFHFFK